MAPNEETDRGKVGQALWPFNPWFFFGDLLTPGFISILSGEVFQGYAPLLALVAGPVAGVHLTFALPLEVSRFGKGVICILMILFCTVSSFALGYAGCFF